MTKIPQETKSLPEAINESHRAACRDAVAAMNHAIECGRLLLDAKGSVQHGQWQAWVAEHCDFSERQARRYMQAAKRTLRPISDADEAAELSREIWGNKDRDHAPNAFRIPGDIDAVVAEIAKCNEAYYIDLCGLAKDILIARASLSSEQFLEVIDRLNIPRRDVRKYSYIAKSSERILAHWPHLDLCDFDAAYEFGRLSHEQFIEFMGAGLPFDAKSIANFRKGRGAVKST